MRRVFISYRRQDAPAYAGRLYDRLAERFGSDRVFMDVAENVIEPGLHWDRVIEDAVGSCEVLLVVIGAEWLTAADEHGHRRLDDRQDAHRLEIATALQREIRVIPVLVGGAQMPDAGGLPEDVRSLARRQAIELSDARWGFDVGRLLDVLDRVLGAVEDATPSTADPGAGAPAGQERGMEEAWSGAGHSPNPGPARKRAVTYAAVAVIALFAIWGATQLLRGGVEDVQVPRLVGLSIDSATALLGIAGLALGDRTILIADSPAPGVVLGQRPEPGRLVAPGTSLTLTVSAAPPDTAAGRSDTAGTPGTRTAAGDDTARGAGGTVAAGRIAVPDLEGVELVRAQRQLSAIGLGVKLDLYAAASPPFGVILRQSHRPQTPVDSATVIRLRASENEPLAPDERERAYRHVKAGDAFVFDSPPRDGSRPQVSLTVLERADLYLVPSRDVQLAPLAGSDPSSQNCERLFGLVDQQRVQTVTAVPITRESLSTIFCARTRVGTTAAVLVRRVNDRPDADGDRALIRYWVWK